MTRIVFYFSATGNCLYIARELASKEGGQIVSIPQVMKEGKFEFEADEIGLVSPVYAGIVPNMVREFLGKAKFKANYLFAVATYGMAQGTIVENIDSIAKENGINFNYIATIIMVDNWLHVFDMVKQKAMDKHIPENLARIQKEVDSHTNWHEPITEEMREGQRSFLEFSKFDKKTPFKFESSEHFCVDENCIKCGTCMRVCPRSNWAVTENGVKVSGTCDYCLACIHNCPKIAIHFLPSPNPALGKGPNPDEHYRNPHVTLAEIIASNNQH